MIFQTAKIDDSLGANQQKVDKKTTTKTAERKKQKNMKIEDEIIYWKLIQAYFVNSLFDFVI